MTGSVSYIAAFVAGLVSFLSPCVLPLIPAYLSFMTGLTTAELAGERRASTRVLVPALLFVLGFSLVFVGLGISATVLGQFLIEYRAIAEKVGGVLVMAFGILMLGIIRVPWLYGEARADMAASRRFGQAAALVMGMSFAAGWTPCVGPILGAILGLAAGQSGDIRHGALLLLLYSMGLGVPFLAVALLFERVRPLLGWLNRHSSIINRVAGAVLIIIGGLIATGRLALLAAWLNRVIPTLSV